MKAVKIVLSLLLVLFITTYFVTNTESQVASNAPTVNTKKWDAGIEYYTSWTALDSLVSSYSTEYFDISQIDGQLQGAAMNISYSYTTPGNTADSLLLTLEGKDANGNVHALGTKILIGSTTGAPTLTTLSTTLTLPFVRFTITNNAGTGAAATNRNATGFNIEGYFPKLDDIPAGGKTRF